MESANFFSDTLASVLGWRAMVDIAILALVFFFTYQTLRRLGTWKIALGILLALALFVLAYYLELSGVSWIYTNLSQVALIGLIVIFQPEIRKIFERIASFRRLGRNGGSQDLSTMLADAAFALASQKRGAILLLPGRDPVDEWVSEGVTLSAVPSVPLMMSIFDPNSPGHDGALVVDDGKLTRFGVRLPVSSSNRLSDDFGTRHHAAMGISEVTDAMAVAVSEERGTVRTFNEGEMELMYNKSQLARKLRDQVISASTSRLTRPIEQRKWKLIGEALASIVIALLLWSAVVVPRSQTIEKAITAPIEFAGTPENLVLTGDKPSTAKLHLLGPESALDEVSASKAGVKIDLTGSSAGTREVFITEENLNLPKEVRLMDVEPQSVTVNIEQIAKRDARVKPQLVGKLEEGLKIDSVSVSPEKVTVYAPEGNGGDEEIYLYTTPVYLENIDESSIIYAKLVAPANIAPVGPRWPDVRVEITISKE